MNEEPVPRSGEEPLDEAAGSAGERAENLVDLVRAVALGIRDTASDMIAAGREGAAEAYEEMWQHYEAKTKRRRREREEE